MRVDALEFGDPVARVHAPKQQELKITERFVAYNSSWKNK